MKIVHCVAAGVIVLVVLVVPASAQVGFEVGANASYLTVPENTAREIEPGLLVGVFVDVPLFSTVSLHPELQYSQRYSKVTFGSGASAVLTDVRIDYLSVPILVRLPLFWGMYVTEGAAFHFPLRATMTGAGVERDVVENLTTPDVSIVIGLGVRIGRVGLEGRWDSGLFEVQDTEGPGEFPTRNRAISALLVIGLPPR